MDADKLGLANATVALFTPSGNVIATTTDIDGNFSFTTVPSQKTYRIVPSKEGYTFAPVDRIFAGLFDDQKNVQFVATKQ